MNFSLPHIDRQKLRTQFIQGLWQQRFIARSAEAVFSFFARLAPREQRAVFAAGISLLVVLGYGLLIDPLWNAYSRLQTRVAAKERELGEIAQLSKTYDTLRRELEQGQPMKRTTLSPFAFLEGLATSTVSREKLEAISPTGRETRGGIEQEAIELRLSGVTLREVVELLYKIDTASGNFRCTNLAIKKRYKDPYSFDVTLTAIALNTR